MYPEQVSACSGFLFLRLTLLVEQLASAFRRLAGDVLHRHALPKIGLVIRCGEVGGDLQIAHEFVVDHHPLGAVLAPALHLVHVDVVDELPQDLIGQRPHLHELADGTDELLPLALALNDTPQAVPMGLDLLFQRFPLLGVLPGQYGVVLLRHFAADLVLIEVFQQLGQQLQPHLRGVELALHRPLLGLHLLVRLLGQQLGKPLLVSRQIVRQPPQLHLHHRGHRVGADIVSADAAAAVVTGVVGAAEKVDVPVDGVGVVPQLFAAVGTAQEVAEDALGAVDLLGLPGLGGGQQLLHLLEGGPVDDGLVAVREDQPVLPGVVDALVVLEGLGAGLEVDHVAAVLLSVEDTVDGRALPLAVVGLGLLAAAPDALGGPVGGAVKVPLVLHDPGDGVGAVALQIQLEDLPHHRRGVRVDDPVLAVLRVLLIAVGWLGERFARPPARVVGRAHLAADVSGVKLVHHVAERGQLRGLVHAGDSVHAVVDGNEADVVIGEVLLRVVAHLQVLAAQAGHVLDDDRRDVAQLDVLQQPLEVRAVEVCAGVAVVHVDAGIQQTVLLGVAQEHLLLVGNGIALFVRAVVAAETAVEGCDAGQFFAFARLFAHSSLLSGSRAHGFRFHFRGLFLWRQICEFAFDDLLHGVGQCAVVVGQRGLGKAPLHHVAGVDDVVDPVPAAQPDDEAVVVSCGFFFHGYLTSRSMLVRLCWR